MRKKLILYFSFLLISVSIIGQTDVEKNTNLYLEDFQQDTSYVLTQKLLKDTKLNEKTKVDYYIKYSLILKSLYKTDSCFYYLDKAEKYYTQKNNKSKLFYILTIKAEIARSLVKRNIANKYIYEAEKLLPENQIREYDFYFYNRRIALLSEYYNNVPDSVVKIKEISKLILENQDDIKDKSLIVYTLNEIGYLDYHRNHKNALKYFLKAHQLAKKYNSKIAFVDVSINLGRYYHHHENNFDLAIYYHNEGLKIAKEIKNLFQIQQCYNEIKNCYILLKDYRNAYLYRDSLANIDLFIEGVNNSKKYELLETRFIINRKEQELKEYKKNIYLLSIILISLFTGFFIMYFYNKKIKYKNKELKRLNDENKFLISETNHRVNNNLQVINLLINELITKFKKEKHQKELEGLLVKVDTIATLHRHLYTSKNNDLIDLKSYLLELLSNFEDNLKKHKIQTYIDIETLVLSAEKAMFIGLLTTELIINSIKHAFGDEQEKNISLNIISDSNSITFTYKDNGLNSKGKKIEPKLVSQICLQLNAKMNILTDNGFCFKTTIKQ